MRYLMVLTLWLLVGFLNLNFWTNAVRKNDPVSLGEAISFVSCGPALLPMAATVYLVDNIQTNCVINCGAKK